MTPSTFTACTCIWWGERHRAKETANACFSSCVCCFIYMCLLYTYESMWHTNIQCCVPVCIQIVGGCFSFVDAVARTHWISTPRNGNRMPGAGCSGNGDALAVNGSLKTTNNQKAIENDDHTVVLCELSGDLTMRNASGKLLIADQRSPEFYKYISAYDSCDLHWSLQQSQRKNVWA